MVLNAGRPPRPDAEHCALLPAMLGVDCRKRQIWCGLAQVLSEKKALSLRNA